MRDEERDFENEARRVARALWPEARYSGAVLVDGRERDGIFETEECIHLLEATTSRRLDKAKEDVGKLAALATKFQRGSSHKAVRAWLVTRDEPTADQRQVTDKHRSFLTILSFSQFQARLIDVRAYLAARENYAFGSVRDPVTGAVQPSVVYVPLALAEARQGTVHMPDDVVEFLASGKRVVLLGDYGAGKSMTLQYVYRSLARRYYKGQSSQFPVYLNLRDHYGQMEPAEILERHARIIGFEHPAHLVRAWRAGYVFLLLDGFDEITALTIQGLWRKLRENRYRTMEPVRRLVSEHPTTLGLAVTGRAHFFDTDAERRTALGLTGSFLELSLNEFTDEQIQQYLERRGLSGAVPAWLPSRPLLVAYLASKGLLKDVVGHLAAGLDPADGWNLLLDKISEREAQIEPGIDGPTVRRILERLATKARSAADGLGSLSSDEIVAAFREICGYPPDDRGMVLLQRLPGLGIEPGEAETRRFIDESFAETCRAGDVCAFAERPYDASLFSGPLECSAGSLGVSVAATKLSSAVFPASKLTAAIQHACELGNSYLAGDLVLAAIEAGHEIKSDVYVREILVPEIELPANMPRANQVHFQDCLFGELEIDPEADATVFPRFEGCFVAALVGRVSQDDLPSGVFRDCVIDAFATGAGTTNQVLDVQLPLGVRVLITVLKKLFERRGRGRKENALYRGLDHRARRLVPEVLQLLRTHGIAFPCRRGVDTIWLPERSARARVGKIASSPSVKGDPLVVAAAALV
jgi:NACHT domain